MSDGMSDSSGKGIARGWPRISKEEQSDSASRPPQLYGGAKLPSPKHRPIQSESAPARLSAREFSEKLDSIEKELTRVPAQGYVGWRNAIDACAELRDAQALLADSESRLEVANQQYAQLEADTTQLLAERDRELAHARKKYELSLDDRAAMEEKLNTCKENLRIRQVQAAEQLKEKSEVYQRAEQAEAELQQVRRWIPVAERLPEMEREVLIWRFGFSGPGQRHEFCVVAKLIEEDKQIFWVDWRDDDISQENVTHWQPLPEPPEVRREREQL